MTTRINVDAHAGWPVSVVVMDKMTDGSDRRGAETIVAPDTSQDFHIWDTRSLVITEMTNQPVIEDNIGKNDE